MADNQVFVSLGSNIDKERNLPRAVKLLSRRVQVDAASSAYETMPVGRPELPTYFNAAVRLTTKLTPKELKHQVLRPLEHAMGRRRTGDRDSPRPIDLDIVLWNRDVFVLDGRPIPDPDLLACLYVALPLGELAPGMKHPVTGETMTCIVRRLRQIESTTPAV